jgi:hypothetical protein
MPDIESRGSFEQVLAQASPLLRPVVVALRRVILQLHPEAKLLAWPRQRIVSFGMGPGKMRDHYAFIAVHPAHVELGFYRGALLAMTFPGLEGSGRTLRFIRMRTVSETRSADVRALLERSIRERERNRGGLR